MNTFLEHWRATEERAARLAFEQSKGNPAQFELRQAELRALYWLACSHNLPPRYIDTKAVVADAEKGFASDERVRKLEQEVARLKAELADATRRAFGSNH